MLFTAHFPKNGNSTTAVFKMNLKYGPAYSSGKETSTFLSKASVYRLPHTLFRALENFSSRRTKQNQIYLQPSRAGKINGVSDLPPEDRKTAVIPKNTTHDAHFRTSGGACGAAHLTTERCVRSAHSEHFTPQSIQKK